MKVRYEVSDGFSGGIRFKDQKEAFDLAMKMAAQGKWSSCFMERLVWDQNGRITVSTVAVKADGSWRKIN